MTGGAERSDRSDAHELRQRVEAPVTAAEREVVLRDERRDPRVVRQDRRSLRAHLSVEVRAMTGRVAVGVEDPHARQGDEARQLRLVPPRSPADAEARPQLSDHDEGKAERRGSFERGGEFGVAPIRSE